MATAQAASREAGNGGLPAVPDVSPDGVQTDAGIELEAALPAVATVVPDGDPNMKAPELALDKPVGHLDGVGVGDAKPAGATVESSVTHLDGADPEYARFLDEKFARLLDEVHKNRPADDLQVIRRAWEFCLKHHEGQKRASGEPYVVHPLEVALVLAELKMDSTAIAAGLLHDAVEDTDVTSDEIAERFGDQVAHIVEGVTKLEKIKFANREDHQAENIRKMLLAMVTDVRVVIIK